MKSLHFRAEKLISLDSKNEISIFSLETRRLLTLYCPPNAVTALVTDLTLDFAILGLQSGKEKGPASMAKKKADGTG